MGHPCPLTLPPLLTVDGLVKRFGGFRALDGLSFAVGAGEVLGLVGPNGSGKTTCINVISGLYRPDGGTILFEGRPIGGLPSHRLVHAGINRTFQVPRPFLTLTVRENVEIALAYGRNRERARCRRAAGVARSRRVRRSAGGRAQQRAAEDARSCARARDRSAAAAGRRTCRRPQSRRTGRTSPAKLKELARSGIALLVVEHLMGFIDQITDRIIVMNAGKEIFEGRLADAARNAQVVEVFLGAEHAA